MTPRILAAVAMFVSCGLALAQELPKPEPKMGGWANVPGGQVWLVPGVHAYEHSTGLVRDMRTGKKYHPVTPEGIRAVTQSSSHTINGQYNPYVEPTVPAPVMPIYVPVPRSPYVVPNTPSLTPLNTVAPPAYSPNPSPPRYNTGSGYYDFGPGNVYLPQYYSGKPCNGCGAKAVAPGEVNSRWPTVRQ